MRLKTLTFLVLTLSTNQIMAFDLPQALLYKNVPIDSLCFFESEDNKANLNTCGINASEGRKITGQNKILTEKGYTGYDYSWKVNNEFDSVGYSYYKYLGEAIGYYYILTANNSGGSGDFTGVYQVVRENDKLNMTAIMSGDRCNNGVADAHIANNQLYFSVNITASDFPSLARESQSKLKAYDDLAACAACCIGVANYVVDINKKDALPTFLEVDLGKELIKPDKGAQGRYQFCFDTLALKYQQSGKSKMDQASLRDFMKTFAAQCHTQ